MMLMAAWAMTGDYYTGGDTDLDAHGGVGDDRGLLYRWRH